MGEILPFSLFEEVGDPWYLKFTTLLWFLAALLYYPATWVTTVAGFKVLGVVHWFVNLVLGMCYTFIIFKFTRRTKAVSKFKPLVINPPSEF